MLQDTGIIKQFVLAGKSTFTIHNTETDKHFTYKVSKCDEEDKNLWFVSLLTGSDIYSYIGIITTSGFKTTKNTKVSNDSIGLKGFFWLWNTVTQGGIIPPKVDFKHAGKCGMCGRKLTTPESIEIGFGPVCSGKL